MVENDTIKLLRECNAGIKMGVSSIDDVLENAENSEFKNLLSTSKEHHKDLENQTEKLLQEYHDDGKDPNPVAKGMSWMKTNIKIAMNEDDKTIADLITDGCNMGVKSLSKYLNQYAAADERSKDIIKKLIKIEEDLAISIRDYL